MSEDMLPLYCAQKCVVAMATWIRTGIQPQVIQSYKCFNGKLDLCLNATCITTQQEWKSVMVIATVIQQCLLADYRNISTIDSHCFSTTVLNRVYWHIQILICLQVENFYLTHPFEHSFCTEVYANKLHMWMGGVVPTNPWAIVTRSNVKLATVIELLLWMVDKSNLLVNHCALN